MHNPKQNMIQLYIILILNVARGRLEQVEVFLSDSFFDRNPPEFTLIGKTSGGPPTSYSWQRNGHRFYDGISFEVASRETESFLKSIIVSKVTVKGRHPGYYRYTVRNRYQSSRYIFHGYRIQGKCMIHIQVGSAPTI